MNASGQPANPMPALSWLAAAMLAGVAIAGLDHVIQLALNGPASVRVLAYAAGLDLLVGVGCGAILAIGGVLMRGARTRYLVLIGLAILAWFLNAPLFDGDWIRRQSYMPILRLAAIAIVLFAAWRLVLFMSGMERRSRVGRAVMLVLGALLLPALGLVNLGIGPFGVFNVPAYASFKLELSVFTFGLAAFVFRPTAARLVRRQVGVWFLAALTILILLMTAGIARDGLEARVVRSQLRSAPYAITLRMAGFIEELVIDRLFPLPEIDVDDIVIEEEANPAVSSKTQERLDELIPGRREFNVIWLAVDALRADHLGCYGYARATSPNIDALAAESIVFERAVTPTPASNLAYSALFSGLPGRLTPAYPASYGKTSELPADFAFPFAFVASGRSTEGLTSFWPTTQRRPDFKVMSLGFEAFNDDGWGSQRGGDQTTDALLAILERRRDEERPFFVFGHYMDAHAPYEVREGHLFDGDRSALGAYDSEIAFCDAEIGRLLRGLDDLGLGDDTIVVLLGDHGESFGEHNDWRHGGSLHEHQTHVPLIMRVPGLDPKRVVNWASLTDVGATTLALLGAGDEHRRFSRDLSPLMVGTSESLLDVTYSDRPLPPDGSAPSRQQSVWSGNLKLLWEPDSDSYRVFDLAADPAELNNIFDPAAEKQRRLIALLRRWNAEIEAYHGKSADSTTEVTEADETELQEICAEVVAELEAAEDEQGARRAVASLRRFLGRSGIDWLPENRHKIEGDLLDRLRVRCEQVLPPLLTDSGLTRVVIRALVFVDSKKSVPVIRAAAPQLTDGKLRLIAAQFRSRHGDATLVPELEAVYPGLGLEGKLQVAAHLSRLGSTMGRELLRSAAEGSHPSDALLATRALAGGGDAATQLRSLTSRNRIWRRADVQEALLEGAMRTKGALSDAILFDLAFSGEDEYAESARAALAERLPGTKPERLSQVFGELFQARESARYGTWQEAVAAFDLLASAREGLLGAFRPLAIRAALFTGDVKAQLRARDLVLRDTDDDRLMAEIQPLLAAAGGEAAMEAEKVQLKATVLNVLVDRNESKQPAAMVSIELHNEGPYVLGGDLVGSLYLALATRDEKGAYLPFRGRRALPFAGLGVGESLRLNLWTRIQRKSGAEWQADLVLVRGDRDRRPVVLAQLDAVKLTPR